MKTSINKLKNGLTVICIQDEGKNTTSVELKVKYGTSIQHVKIDGKEYFIKPGLAHLLEHTLIENSQVGNLVTYFQDNYVFFNGFTSDKQTTYPLETVKDFKKHLKVLLTNINKVDFNEKKLEEIKLPVIDEIIRSKDRTFYKFNRLMLDLNYNKTHFQDNLGKIEEVKEMSIDELKLIHDAFYQPENQILGISGNVDEKDIIPYIEKIYADLNIQHHDVEILDEKDDEKYDKEKVFIQDEKYDPVASINYKFNLSNFSSEEKLKLDYYISCFLDYKFGGSSFCHKKIIDDKLSTYNVEIKSSFITKDILNLKIILITEKHQEFFSLIDETMQEKDVTEEFFALWKKNSAIGLLKRNKVHKSLLQSLITNIECFDIWYNEDFKWLDELNYQEYQELINRIDFSNKVYFVQEKDK